ncbi:MAG: dihydrofolate reductase [Firmicutes bacterium]|nr:dihydrofolate reductase [Bacillota bacterium]
MDAVVNVTENWGIGLENRLLVSISADLRRFRKLTEGKTVIMGRKTLESLPHSRPLPHRRNLILSRDPNYRVEGAEVFSSVSALLEAVKELPTDEVCLIGGASLYEALLPYCRRVFVTKTLCRLPADRFFPNLDETPNWSIAERSEIFEENGTRFQYVDYVNQTPLTSD